MADRRNDSRPDSPDRRTFPRPPLWLNLTLLAIALATFLYARHERTAVQEQTKILFHRNDNSPAELNRIRDELAGIDVSQAQLAKEIDGRMQMVESAHSEQFYLAIDTTRKKMLLRFGKEIVREMDVQIGEPKVITATNGRTWTFVPLKGAFNITGKESDAPWEVPGWAYAMNGQEPPKQTAVVQNGLGRFVVAIGNGYVIHSTPAPDSPLKGPKPGSFLVSDADMAAIWPRLTTETRVYIF